MSIEAHAFFTGEIPDTAALTRTMQELGFPISIVTPDYPMQGHSGFMPMLLHGDRSGAEFHLDDGRKDQVKDIDPRFDRCVSFRFGGDFNELICATCAAVAIAKLMNGVFYEGHDGVLMPVDEAIEYAKKTIEDVQKEVGM
jgi:hypothetical protein